MQSLTESFKARFRFKNSHSNQHHPLLTTQRVSNSKIVATAQRKIMAAMAGHSTPDSRGAASRLHQPTRRASTCSDRELESPRPIPPPDIFGLTRLCLRSAAVSQHSTQHQTICSSVGD